MGGLLCLSELHHNTTLILINISNQKKENRRILVKKILKVILTAGRGHTAVLRPARQRF